MTATFSKNLGIFMAEQFRNAAATSNLYLSFGYSKPWINDYSPPQANTSETSYYETWKNLIGGKKINGSDIRHVVKRHDWTANTVYAAYDQSIDSLSLKDANTSMYVLTTDYNVYKCIANNNGQASTFKPTSTNPSAVFQTGDQYMWKYMYTLTDEEKLRFLTTDYMPVKTLYISDNSLQWLVQQDAVEGAINNIIVTNSGTGYTSNNISIAIKGDGLFANAYAVRNVTTSTIGSIVLDVKGSGYTYANATITSTRGAGATLRVAIDPPGGHGSDALSELGGSYVMINTKINGSEGGILPSTNDFRQISIIQDPTLYGTSNPTANQVFSQITTLSLGSGSSTDYIQDEIVYQGTDLPNATYKAVVVVWDSANSLLSINNVEGNPTSQLIIGNTSTASRYVSSINNPDLQPYSGYVLYKDNLNLIKRSEDQSEEYKIVLSF
jgi:hypothetical protein